MMAATFNLSKTAISLAG